MVIIGGVVNKRVANSRAMDAAERTSDEFVATQYQRMLSDAPMTASAGEFDRYVAQLEADLANVTGPDGQVSRAAVSLLPWMQPSVAAYTEAVARLEGEDGLDPTMWKSKADIDKFMATVKTAREASVKLDTTLRGMGDRFGLELQAQNVPSQHIRAAQSGFMAAATIDVSIQALAEDLIVLDRMTDAANLLKKEWGRWRVNTDGEVIFNSTASMNKFNALIDEMLTAADRQLALQRQAMTKRRSAGSRGR